MESSEESRSEAFKRRNKIMTPTIRLTRPTALVDERIDLQITGLTPHTLYTLRAEMRDDMHRRWQSEAHFTADADGRISPSVQAAEGGTYSGVDNMGLFWSMQLLDREGGLPPFYMKMNVSPHLVRLSVHRDGAEQAATEFDWQFLDEHTVMEEINDTFLGKYFAPKDGRDLPALLVVGGSGGWFGWSEQIASMLAARGYATLAVAYFDYAGRGRLPTGLAEIPLEPFQAALHWLRLRPETADAPAGVIGISKGGELALLLGATFPEDIGAVISFAPSPYVMQGIRVEGATSVSSWTRLGEPLDFLPYPDDYQPGQNFDKTTLRDLHIRAAQNTEACRRSRIPVERLQGPLLLVSGDCDGLGPTSEWAEEIVESLRDHHFPYAVEHLRYPEAGHSFFLPHLPPVAIEYPHVTAAFIAAAERHMWPQLLRFLQTQKAPR